MQFKWNIWLNENKYWCNDWIFVLQIVVYVNRMEMKISWIAQLTLITYR